MRVLFTGTSGMGMSAALAKLESDLGDAIEVSCLKLEDYLIESHRIRLCELGFAEGFVNREISRISSEGGLQVLLRHPKNYLRQLWLKSFHSMLEAAQNTDNVFFSMHSIYYQTQNREFFIAYDEDVIRQLDIEQVVTLIDDIYDIHTRLSGRGQVFSDRSLQMRFPNDPARRAFSRVSRLVNILDWRSKEILAAERLAHRLNVPHVVFATKHPTRIAKAIVRQEVPIVYLSHPISQVRRLRRDGRESEAAEVQSEINMLANELESSGAVAPLLPTTIDELIVLTDPESNGQACLPGLAKRWGLPGDDRDLLYSPPAALPPNPLDVEGIFLNEQGEVHPNVDFKELASITSIIDSILKPMIADQIDARDRTLVDQSSAICVYRPYFDGNHSSGVGEEIAHRTQRHRFGIDSNLKPCIIYCPPIDLARVRVNQLLQDIEKKTHGNFTPAQRNALLTTVQSDSQPWERLKELAPSQRWTGDEILHLLERAGISVGSDSILETGALGMQDGAQAHTLDSLFFEELTPNLNSHPLEKDLLLGEGDVWIDQAMTPRQFSEAFINHFLRASKQLNVTNEGE